MKLYKICNKISLLLHVLASAAGYFVMEAICRHSFIEAWNYMTQRPLVFAYNAAFIFTSSLIVYLFHRRVFWRILVTLFWLILAIINGVSVSQTVFLAGGSFGFLAVSGNRELYSSAEPCYTVYRTGSASDHRCNEDCQQISACCRRCGSLHPVWDSCYFTADAAY